MTDMTLTMWSRTATSEDLFLYLFSASRKLRPTLVKTFGTSNELIMKKSGILAWGEWYVEGLGARRGWRLMIFFGFFEFAACIGFEVDLEHPCDGETNTEVR